MIICLFSLHARGLCFERNPSLGDLGTGNGCSGSVQICFTIREEKFPDTQAFITKHEKLTPTFKQVQKKNFPFKYAQLSFPFQIQVGVPQTAQLHLHAQRCLCHASNNWNSVQQLRISFTPGFQCLKLDFVCLFFFFVNNPLQRCSFVEFPSGQITDQSTQREAPS